GIISKTGNPPQSPAPKSCENAHRACMKALETHTPSTSAFGCPSRAIKTVRRAALGTIQIQRLAAGECTRTRDWKIECCARGDENNRQRDLGVLNSGNEKFGYLSTDSNNQRCCR